MNLLIRVSTPPVPRSLRSSCRSISSPSTYKREKPFEASGGWDETVYAGEEIRFAMAMKKLGRFVIIRSPVITSGRKLRAHSGREIFATIIRLAWKGGKAVSSRRGLDLWYGPRKPDPLDTQPLTQHASRPGSGDSRTTS